ncbi:hypothetical protein N7501_003799 [Penicillium viridicatum]|nr:hypothetical protein N7501_003799 [Penicillium viridicatum]
MWNEKNATKETAEATSVMISAEITKAEQPTKSSRQGLEAVRKLKDEKKARAKAQQAAAKKLKDEKKARAKAQQVAAKKLKDEKKARAKAQKKAAKRLNDQKIA